ncbi:pyruvate formate lyase family protein [Halanaerobium kushneri]|uniref:Pyruvate-formate lyase n=1 Tax=Halanaerobium kushneri TaxID=56779 RepID=A0A1N6R192_9FIRM|nr:pyruvate formate lyase family protein [Halanaerobium kushneri]SIQ22559.1 Pyruvate-formate lyase [Halanaerobium kushneri]
MRQTLKSLDAELLFTETYKKYKDASKSIRELECLKVQLPTMLRPMKDNDLLAGRIEYNTIGFHHIVYGEGTSDEIDRCGYCYDLGRVKEKLNSSNIDEEYERLVEDMCDFWETENTNYKARQAFSATMKYAAPTDDWVNESAIIHPLYRIAEFQVDHEKLIQVGIPGLRKEINNGLKKAKKYGRNKDFYTGLNGALDLILYAWDYYIKDINRQLKAADITVDKAEELHEIKNTISNIKNNKPATFREALQLIWIFNIVAGITDFNRMDVVLGDLYVNDRNNDIITEEKAIQLLTSLFKLIDQLYGRNSRVILGGVGRWNENNADEFALIAMEATKRAGGMFPQTSLRYYEGMNSCLMDKALDLLGTGLTFPVLYNDDVNVPGVEKAFKVTREVAEDYSFFGCGEFILGHRSLGTPNVIINMPKIVEVTLNNGVDLLTGDVIGLELGNLNDFKTFEDFFAAYDKQIKFFIEKAAKIQEQIYKTLNEEGSFLLQSMLMSDCLSKGKAALDGGIQHLGGTIETYGNITTSDSLAAIKEAIYDKKTFSAEYLLEMLNDNFKGFEKERRYLLNISKYGNDEAQADRMAARVHEHICNITKKQNQNTCLDSFLVVEINNSANTTLGKFTAATADGRLCRTPLSNANGPVQGMDTQGITALINSLTQMRCDIHAGIAQNFKFSKKLFNKERNKLKQLLYTYFDLGGSQCNISVVNKEDLEKAMLEPEKYQNIVVRVGGYTARFVDLEQGVQKDIIGRTIY